MNLETELIMLIIFCSLTFKILKYNPLSSQI